MASCNSHSSWLAATTKVSLTQNVPWAKIAVNTDADADDQDADDIESGYSFFKCRTSRSRFEL